MILPAVLNTGKKKKKKKKHSKMVRNEPDYSAYTTFPEQQAAFSTTVPNLPLHPEIDDEVSCERNESRNGLRSNTVSRQFTLIVVDSIRSRCFPLL